MPPFIPVYSLMVDRCLAPGSRWHGRVPAAAQGSAASCQGGLADGRSPAETVGAVGPAAAFTAAVGAAPSELPSAHQHPRAEPGAEAPRSVPPRLRPPRGRAAGTLAFGRPPLRGRYTLADRKAVMARADRSPGPAGPRPGRCLRHRVREPADRDARRPDDRHLLWCTDSPRPHGPPRRRSPPHARRTSPLRRSILACWCVRPLAHRRGSP
jgi:hypothetical protein